MTHPPCVTDEHTELLRHYGAWRSHRWLWTLAVVALGYCAFFGLGLLLSQWLASVGSSLLPACALALAATLVLGRKALWGVWAGHVLSLLLAPHLGASPSAAGTTEALIDAMVEATFAATQAWVGYALLRSQLTWPNMLREPGQVFKLTGLGAVSALVHPVLHAACQWLRLWMQAPLHMPASLPPGLAAQPGVSTASAASAASTASTATSATSASATSAASAPIDWAGWLLTSLGEQALAGALAIVLITPLLIFWSTSGRQYPVRKMGLTAIVVIGTALSAAAAQMVLTTEIDQTLVRLGEANARIQRALQLELRGHEEALHVMGASMGNLPVVGREEFARVAAPLLSLADNFYALSWNPVITDRERADFEALLAQEQGAQHAHITERNASGTLQTAAHRPLHVAVQTIEPRARNQAALGFDVYSDPVRRRAIDEAMASQSTGVTQRIRLVQDTTASWALLALEPVLTSPAKPSAALAGGQGEQGIRGFATAVIQVQSLVNAVVKPNKFQPALEVLPTRGATAVVAYRFIDLSAPDAVQELWSSDWPAPTADQPPVSPRNLAPTGLALPRRSTIEFAFLGKNFQLQTQPLPGFWGANLPRQPHLVLDAGLVLTGVLSVLFLLTSGQQEQLRYEVRERTIELEQSQMVLQDAMQHYRQNSEQITAIIDQTPVGYMAFDEQDRLILGNQTVAHLLSAPWIEDRPALGTVIQHIQGHLSMPGLSDFSFGNWLDQESAPPRISCRLHRAQLHHEGGAHHCVDLEFIRYEHGPIRKVMLLVDVTQDEQLEHSKSQFIASAAHEIRTPLTSILGYSELLLARPDTPEPLRHEMLTRITQQSRQIEGLITKLLSVAELELNGAACLKRVQTDMTAWTQKACSSFNVPPHRTPPVLLATNKATTGLVDPRKLQRALHELLSNAYLFSPADTQVQVTLAHSPRQDGHATLEIQVHNQGAGMTEAQIARAKERFYRVDQSGEHPGFGLGLTLADMVVHLHHGQLVLASQAGQFTTATIKLAV